jgi:hypothetical protein
VDGLRVCRISGLRLGVVISARQYQNYASGDDDAEDDEAPERHATHKDIDPFDEATKESEIRALCCRIFAGHLAGDAPALRAEALGRLLKGEQRLALTQARARGEDPRDPGVQERAKAVAVLCASALADEEAARLTLSEGELAALTADVLRLARNIPDTPVTAVACAALTYMSELAGLGYLGQIVVAPSAKLRDIWPGVRAFDKLGVAPSLVGQGKKAIAAALPQINLAPAAAVLPLLKKVRLAREGNRL